MARHYIETCVVTRRLFSEPVLKIWYHRGPKVCAKLREFANLFVLFLDSLLSGTALSFHSLLSWTALSPTSNINTLIHNYYAPDNLHKL